jgi:hypothetical protein
LAVEPGLLIASRVIQGTGAAMLAPADRSYGAPSYGGPVYTTFTLPSFFPAAHGAGAATELTSSNQPVVNLYRDIQFLPSSAG